MRHVPDSERYPEGMIISGIPVNMRSTCQQAREIVEAWPEWKRNILENSSKPTVAVPRIPVDARDHLDRTFHVYDTVSIIDTGEIGKVIDVAGVAGIVLVRADERETWVKPREIEHAPDADGTTRYHDDRGHVFAEVHQMEPEIQAKLDEILAEANSTTAFLTGQMKPRSELVNHKTSGRIAIACLLAFVVLYGWFLTSIARNHKPVTTYDQQSVISNLQDQVDQLEEEIAAKQAHLDAWAKKYERLRREAEFMEDQISHWENTGQP